MTTSWNRVCDRSELEVGQGREFLIAGRVVAVFFDGSQYFALDGMCAHQGGPIAQGKLDRNCLTCPWHGWQYDINNGHNVLTGKHMLDCFELELRDHELWIKIESESDAR